MTYSNSQLATKKGFTLVELSIVLVIVGLLVGGILVGQSLIQSVKISSEVRSLSQYAIAIEQFKQKFKQEAGDTNFFPNPGNNDGDTSDAFGTCPTRYFESHAVWSHLSQSGMLTGKTYVLQSPYPECGGNYQIAGPTITTENGGTYNYIYQTVRSGFDFGGNRYKRLFLIRYDPEFLWGVENKLDDGIPSDSTGRILSYASISQGNTVFACSLAGFEQELAETGYNTEHCYVSIYFNESL